MRKILPLSEMLEDGFARLGAHKPRESEVVLDTNVFAFNVDYYGEPRKFVVTSGVVEELARFPEVFPDEAVYRVRDLLNPEVVECFVSPEDEFLITRASLRNPKNKERRDSWEGPGWADTQQIGRAMNRAREGAYVVMVSNDKDIRNVVEELGKEVPDVREKVACVSARDYIGRYHGLWLGLFNSKTRRGLLRGMEDNYKVA